MERKILGNAFSLQMLDLSKQATVKVEPVNMEEVANADFTSAIGHADTAAILQNLLGKEVPCQRINVRLDEETILYVAQVTGGRLPEGSTTLPEGYSLTFVKVTLN